MFSYRVKICSLFGINVRIDATWLLLAALIVWSFATSAYPQSVRGLPPGEYWAMAVATALGLMGSILFHEMAHALVARRYGIQISGITLFIFGGVAEMETEPPSARSELLMAIAGPAASMVLGLSLFALLGTSSASPAVASVLQYLGVINWTLAIFNLVPAFSLDGGRVLRAALWWWGHDLLWATRIASGFGNGFGAFLILLGLFRVITAWQAVWRSSCT